MQEKINNLINKEVNLCAELSNGNKVELFRGKLTHSHLVQEKFIVGDFNSGPTFSFALNQLKDIIDSDIIMKFCLKV